MDFTSHPSSITLRLAAILACLGFCLVSGGAYLLVRDGPPPPIDAQAESSLQGFAQLLVSGEMSAQKGNLSGLEAALAQVQARSPMLAEVARVEPRLAHHLPALLARAEQLAGRRIELLATTWDAEVGKLAALERVFSIDYGPRNAAELRAALDQIAARADLWRRISAAAWRYRTTVAEGKVIISPDYSLDDAKPETLSVTLGQMNRLSQLYPEAVAMLQ